MNKYYRCVQNYLIYALPFVLIEMVWSSFQSEHQVTSNSNLMVRLLWEVFSWNLMLWFAVLIFFFCSLVLVPSVREQTLKSIANIKDRDEREDYITGRASKFSFISSLSVLILLLFLSIFNLQIRNLPPEQAINGHTKSLSIGLNFKIFDEAKKEVVGEDGALFETKDIPFSKTGIILFIILWQLISFHLRARREMKLGLEA